MIRFSVSRWMVVALVSGAIAGEARAQVQLQMQGGDHVNVTINGQPFTDFYFGSSYAKPYLHPLRTADGTIVTRRYPMETVEGETRDHPHHKGLWIGYGEVNDSNLWEMEPSNKGSNRGRIDVKKVGKIKGGKKSGTVETTFEWRDKAGGDLLEEHRLMKFYAEPSRRTIDFDITWKAATEVHFADTKEGFFAIRLADAMNEKNGGKMINSDGAQGESSVWGKKAKWIDYAGRVSGHSVGIAIFDHPENKNSPPRWHSRAYGLFAVNPWGEKDFDKTGSKSGGLTLNTGDSIRMRYRVLIHGDELNSLTMPEAYSQYLEDAKKK